MTSIPAQVPVDTKRQRQCVLVIDDHPASISGLFAFLRSKGLDVLIATSGEIGLERAVYAQPDIILLDVILPSIDGFETCRRLKANHVTAGIPVIFMTVAGDLDDKVRGFNVGAVDYVAKPLYNEEVFARLSAHLRLRGLARHLEENVANRTADLNSANARLSTHIVERARIEAALRASEELHRVTLGAVSEAVLVTDEQGALVYVSPSASTLFRRSLDAILGDGTISALLGNDLFNPGELQAHGEITNIERSITTGDDLQRVLLVSVKRVQIHRGTLLYTCRDVTDHKLLEERLRQSQRLEAIGRLAGSIAHDFNNLLSVIISFSDLLREQYEQGTVSIDDIMQIRRAGDRGSALVRQLLAFSRQQVLDLQPLNLNDIVANSSRMLMRMLGPSVTLNLVLEDNLSLIEADASQIEQIIVNLVVNARDAMPEGGVVTIETTELMLDDSYARRQGEVPAGMYVMLAVSDTGIGMDKATAAHIFEPFFTTKQPGQGTGLGLATVHGIVKQSNGHIWLYSEPGQGTVFKIYFPRATNAVHSPSHLFSTPPITSDSLHGSETVVVVEDESAIRELVGGSLAAHGYRTTCFDSRQALTALENHATLPGQIDLLITDVHMEYGTGHDLVKQFRECYPHMRVLYISGYTSSQISRYGIHAAREFLQKPFTTRQLLQRARSILDAPPA